MSESNDRGRSKSLVIRARDISDARTSRERKREGGRREREEEGERRERGIISE